MKNIIRLTLCVMLFALCASAEAQQPTNVPRIGFLSATSLSTNRARIEAFRDGLRELGYVEGKNIVIEYRFAEGKFDRLPDHAAELVQLKVDVMVTGGSPGTRAAQQATGTIPLVMTLVGDPVPRFVASLAKPGGNITGVALAAGEGFSGKWVELLKEAVPKVARGGRPSQSNSPARRGLSKRNAGGGPGARRKARFL